MKRDLTCAILMLAALAAPPSDAMEFNLVGTTLIMSGPVVGDDLARLIDHLATDRVKLVVLHNSPGGDVWNGLRLAERIRDKGLPTAVSGRCASACGLIFLGGVQRSFSDGQPLAKTMVGLHGAHNRETKQAMPQAGAQLAWFIRRMSDWKFPSDLVDRTVYPKDPGDFIYIFHPHRAANQTPSRSVVECLRQADAKAKCSVIDALDPVEIGVITNLDIVVLEQPVKDVLGRL